MCPAGLGLPQAQWGPCKRPSGMSPPWPQDRSRPGREPRWRPVSDALAHRSGAARHPSCCCHLWFERIPSRLCLLSQAGPSGSVVDPGSWAPAVGQRRRAVWAQCFLCTPPRVAAWTMWGLRGQSPEPGGWRCSLLVGTAGGGLCEGRVSQSM